MSHLKKPTNVTWDGLAASEVPPYGAAVVVWRRVKGGEIEVLLLHRAHHGPDYHGDWAWTPPTGCRFPDEPIRDCAQRELYEEAGVRLPIDFTNYGNDDWHMYMVEAPADAAIRLIDKEHDSFGWFPVNHALQKCTPAKVCAPLRVALATLA